MKTPALRLSLFGGILVPLIFWITTIIAAILHGNYNHFRDTISELGAIGTRSETLMTISTWISTAISIIFLAGLFIVCRKLKLNLLPLMGVAGFAIMFAWAAIFHSGNPMHGKGGPALLPLLAGPLLSAILWKGDQLKALRRWSIWSFVIMLLILLRAIPLPVIQNNYTGLIQRLVHFGWSVWFIALSVNFLNYRLQINSNLSLQ